MRIVRFIFDGIGSGSTNDEASLGSNSGDKLAWKPTRNPFRWASWPAHCVRAGKRAAAAVPDSMEGPDLFHSRSPRAARKFWTLSPRASESAKDALKKNGMMPGSCPCGALTKNGKVLMSVPADRIHSLDPHESNYHHRGQPLRCICECWAFSAVDLRASADENPFASPEN